MVHTRYGAHTYGMVHGMVHTRYGAHTYGMVRTRYGAHGPARRSHNQVRGLRSYLTEVLAVNQFLAGARKRSMVAKASMSDDAMQAQAPIAQLLRGDMQGLAASGGAAAEGVAAAEGATEAASSSSPTLRCRLLLVLRATASPGQAPIVTARILRYLT